MSARPTLYSSPVDPGRSRLASPMGMRPGRTSGQPRFHAGADLVGAVGDPVYAASDGVVFRVVHEEPFLRAFNGYGNVVVIYHPADNVWSMYAHLSQTLVQQGQQVHAGQLIARVGNANNGRFPGMGAHLHFEVRRPMANGGAPFPGQYQAHNIDPTGWLEEHGVHFGWRGRISFDGSQAVRPSGLSGLGAQVFEVKMFSGLGNVAAADNASTALDNMDFNADYEPVEPEPDWGLWAGVMAGTMVVVVVTAIWLTDSR